MSYTLVVSYIVFFSLAQLTRHWPKPAKIKAVAVNLYLLLAMVAIWGTIVLQVDIKSYTYSLPTFLMFLMCAGQMLVFISEVAFREDCIVTLFFYRLIMLSAIAAHLFVVLPFFTQYIS